MTAHQNSLSLTGEATLAALPRHSYVAMVSNPRRQLVYAVEIATRQVSDHRPVPGGDTARTPPRVNLTFSRFAPIRVLSNVQEQQPNQSALTFTPVAPTVATWTPLNIGSDLVAWFDATHGVYTDAGLTLASDGQTVRQWNDKSGNGFHVTQVSAGMRPTYRASSSGMSARPALDFAMDANILTNGSVSLGGTQQQITMLAVVNPVASGTPSRNRIFSYTAAADASESDSAASCAIVRDIETVLAIGDSLGGLRLHANPDNFVFLERAISAGTKYRFGAAWRDNLVGHSTFLDNVQSTASVTYGGVQIAATGRIGVGGSPHVSVIKGWGGLISEIIFAKGNTIDSHQTALDAYFRSKWGF